jgi:glyoxylase-like metal-dependent hydrolase (beta-lactamase superfamily II)
MNRSHGILRIKNKVVNANTYLIHLADNKTLALIDPGSNVDEICSHVLETGKKLAVVLLTHGHFDHVMGAEHVSKKFGCPIFMSKRDAYHQKHNAFYLRSFHKEYQYSDFTFIDINELPNSIKAELEVIITPGHSDGSVCFLFGDSMFTGDTVLSRNVFSKTVRGSNLQQQKESVANLLSILKPEMWIYPGHGTPDSLMELLKVNQELADLASKVL